MEEAWWGESKGELTEKTPTGFNFASVSGQTAYPEIGWVGLPSRG